MKKLFSYLLISSMVVLSSCTNYDDQFDDLNTQINTLKTQIEGFSSLSSGLTALQGTVASLQTAIANIPVTPATDISGLESTQATLTAALTSLAADVKALQDTLATAATAAEVAALQTALTAAQSDLTELLASNNVYSDDLVINSSATLEVAKSLGSKLTILNADLIIDQDANMSAADLQAVTEVIVTTTGNIQYEMASKSSTVATFSKLTSAGNIYVDVAGDISFPELENATTLHIGDSHTSSISSFSAPKLTKITAFGDGGSSQYLNGDINITTGVAHAIDLPKATAITLSALATYDNGALAVTGDKDFDFDLSAITSKTAAGSSNPFDLSIDGAKTLSLPLITKGNIVAENVETVNLPLFIGGSTDNFLDAVSLTLGAYTEDLETGADLETLVFTGAKPASADDADDFGPSVDLTASIDAVSITIGGVVNAVNAHFDTTNKSLETFVLTGKANAVTIEDTESITALTLAHTAEQAEFASLTIKDNIEVVTLSVDSLVSAASLIITGNDALTTISFDALKTQGGAATAPVNVDVSDNDLTASLAEYAADAESSSTYATGSFTSTSGMKDLKAYLDAAIVKYNTTGGTVYAAFDTLDAYFDEDDVADPDAPFTLSTTKGAEPRLEVVYVSDAGYTAGTSTGSAKAKRSFVVELDSAGATDVDIDINGGSVADGIALNANAAVAVGEILTTAQTAAATALGATMSASRTASGTAEITFGALDSTAENSPTSATLIGQIATGNTFKVSDTARLTVGGQTVTASHTTGTGSTTTELAAALVTLYNAKYGAAIRDYNLTSNAGVITVSSRDLGSGGVGNLISVVLGTKAAATSTTNIGFRINTVDTADNKTVAATNKVLVTFESSTAGSPLSEIGYPGKATVRLTEKTVIITSATADQITVTELTTSVGGNASTQSAAVTATNTYPTDSRADVRNPDGDITTAPVGELKDHDYTSWL